MDGWMDEVGRYVQGGLDSRRDGYDGLDRLDSVEILDWVGMMF